MGYFHHDPPPPKFGKTALELLSDKTVDPPSLASAFGFQTAMGLMGAGCHGMKNWIYRRPWIAGVHLYPIYFVAAFVGGHYFLQYRKNYWAERDAVLRHYIELHPDDFPPPERKKYGDVLLKWIPIR